MSPEKVEQASREPGEDDVVLERNLTEAETLPSAPIEPVDLNYQKMLTQFQDKAKFVQGVKKAAVALTYPSDWLGRKAKDGSYTYDLMGTGAERIKSVCPIGFMNLRRYEEKWSKEDGPGYTIYYEGEVYLGTPKAGTLPVLGACSSNDDFFSMETVDVPYNADNSEHKTLIDSGEGRLDREGKRLYIRRHIPASEVTRENIIKSALTNLVGNGVSRVLGLRRMTSESLKEFGIDPTKVPSFEYGSKTKESGRLAPAAEEKRTAIWRMLCEMNEGDEAKAADSLKGRTAFKDFQGQSDYKRLSEAQINIVHPKIKQTYDAWTGEKQAADAAADGKEKQGNLFKNGKK
jgi:hypothetical protein